MRIKDLLPIFTMSVISVLFHSPNVSQYVDVGALVE
jgi:hypothetical protein